MTTADIPMIDCELLATYTGPALLRFANGDVLAVGAGDYWTAAFGVVVDTSGHRCLTTPAAAWKVGPSLRR